MELQKKHIPSKLLVLAAYLVMLAVNALANIVPFNGITTGEVSDAYANLFAPAGLTFAIWGLIYLALAGYALYQLGFFQQAKEDDQLKSDQQVRFLFILSSLANAAWMFAWHYRQIPLSLSLILILLLCLAAINVITRKRTLPSGDRFFVRLPFAIYFGWITVATIANVTALLVDMGWNGAGIGQATWTVLVLLAGLLIGWITTVFLRSVAYGLVLVWVVIPDICTDKFSGIIPKNGRACVIVKDDPAVQVNFFDAVLHCLYEVLITKKTFLKTLFRLFPL